MRTYGLLAITIITITGCDPAPPASGNVDMLRPCEPFSPERAGGEAGVDGRLGFALLRDGLGAVPTATPILTGGRVWLVVASDLQEGIGGVTTSDAAVVTPSIDLNDQMPRHRCGATDLVRLAAGSPGVAVLSFFDRAGRALDRIEVTVTEAESLTYYKPWNDEDGPPVLAGSLQALYVHPIGAGGVLMVGNDAVRFTLEGLRPPDNPSDAPPLPGLFSGRGDGVAFVADSGTRAGAVIAECPRARLRVPIRVVDPDAIDDLELAEGSMSSLFGPVRTLAVRATHKGAAVWGAHCAFRSTPADLEFRWVEGGWIGDSQVTEYVIHGPSGKHRIECTVGGRAAALDWVQ